MESKIYRKEKGNRILLLFFAGWGTTPEVADRLSLPEGWDYVAFWDYRDLTTPLPDLTGYDRVCLAAWSMGVWAADVLAPRLPRIDAAVALGGTPMPMHDSYGIPIAHFEGTLRNLDEMNREKFDRRMAGGKKLLAVYKALHARSTEDLKGELQGVFDQVREMSDFQKPRLPWTQAFVSERDLIVPPANQTSYWDEAGVPVTLLESAGHYPFLEFASWPEIFLPKL